VPQAWDGSTEGVLVMETMSGTESEVEQEGCFFGLQRLQQGLLTCACFMNDADGSELDKSYRFRGHDRCIYIRDPSSH